MPIANAVYGGFARIQQFIERTQPDALLVVGTDHGRIYPLTNQPQFVIGVSATGTGIGDSGLPKWEVPLHQEFARAILDGCVEAGVDLSYSESTSLDHSFITPLMLSVPQMNVPVIPFVQNTRLPPMPTFKRSYEVGKKIAQAIRQGPEGRIVVIGTGGLSHWVGSAERLAFFRRPAGERYGHEQEYPLELPETGHINVEFDNYFLDLLKRGQAAIFIEEWSSQRTEEVAGNGASELRNWLLTAGIVDDAPIEILGYAPVPEWHTGSAVVQFQLPPAA